MKPQAFVYKTSGEIIPVFPKNGTDFTLFEMQSLVKGSIEMISLKDGQFMIVNEEGKLFDFEENTQATSLFRLSYNTTDYICGDAIVTPNQYVK